MSQDLPPAGGYGPVQYRRHLPTRGVAPRYLVVGMLGVCAYGFYATMQGIKERRECARERIWARIHLTPMLQAENDRDDVRRYLAAEARERELMKDVKGWEFGSVYNSKRFVRPTYTVAPPSEYMVKEKDLEAEIARREGRA